MRDDRGTRQRILELAIAVIDESGEASVRTNQLAAQAGVTVPSLYHHFTNREGLIEAAQAERFVRQLRADGNALVEMVKDCTSADELRAALMTFFARRDAVGGEQRRWQRINALGSAYARPHLMARIGEATDEVATRAAIALAPFQRSGHIRRDVDLRALVVWYVGASVGKVLAEIDTSTIDVTEWETLMNRATLALVFGDTTTPE